MAAVAELCRVARGSLRRAGGHFASPGRLNKPATSEIVYCLGRNCLMKTRAAVAVAAGKPLEIMEVDLEGPRD
ncbi:hypothetical protein EOA31_28660, partial [Mesorhizobium sp. M4B.F.Ca.ET.049.02.1.2]